MKKNPSVFELKLKIKPTSHIKTEIIKGLLSSLGVSIQNIIEYNRKTVSYLSLFFNNCNNAYSLKKRILKLNLKNIAVLLRSINPDNWQDKFKKSFRPFNLTDKIEVVPTWLKGRYKTRKRSIIYLDPQIAFGTGLHETTRLMSELIEECSGHFESFFDIGAGTGILSVVASFSGVKKIESIDISRDIVKVAKQNLDFNGCKNSRCLVCDIGNYKKKQKYDFVASNLTTHDLIRYKRKLSSLVKKDKYLAVSGVSLENLKKLNNEFRTLKLKKIKVKKGKNWSAVLFKKNE